MSVADSLLNDLSFQRLEEFPFYVSSIKSFGKPIISALLSPKERNEISAFKEAANRREAEILSLRKVRNAYYKNQDDVGYASNEQIKSLQNDESVLPRTYTLILNSDHSKPPDYPLSDEMHVAMSKIPSSDICSTVHKGVIVCPNEMPAVKKCDLPDSIAKYPSDQRLDHQFTTSECHLRHSGSDQIHDGDNLDNSIEAMASVSDDEEQQGDSIIDDTDFESLPTVVCAMKLQDTDDESNVTCLTQSTDLDKYMDCSIEYSSPDDLTAIASSQMSSQVTLSCRSDDASSETLVNTESELTPCASAMAELNGYTDNNQSYIEKSSSCIALDSSQDRAYSVDSYLGSLNIASVNPHLPLMKKSQSEPSHSDVQQKISLVQEILPQSNGYPDTEIGDPSQNFDVVNECKSDYSQRKKRHIRSNSYTLDSPSSALILAHADCGCDLQDAGNITPHSCTPDQNSKTSLNLAFRKEKVNLVLPPTPDRDKMFPILSSSSTLNQTSSSDVKSSTVESNSASESSFLNSSMESKESNGSSRIKPNEDFQFSVEELSPVVECHEKNIDTEDKSYKSTSNFNKVQMEENRPDKVSDICSNHEVKGLSPNEVMLDIPNSGFEMSSANENKTDGIQLIMGQIFQDIQESQQMRVNQLLEEQSKQWLKLQEDFKEQERQLCAKLNLVNIPSGIPIDYSKEGFESNENAEEIPTKLGMRPNVSASSLSDTSFKEFHPTSDVKSIIDCSDISSEMLHQSNNIPEAYSSGTLLTYSSETLHTSDSFHGSELLPSDNFLSETSDTRNVVQNIYVSKNSNKEYHHITVENSLKQKPIISDDAQTASFVSTEDEALSNFNKSPVNADCESETFTANTSLSRTADVPSSLSLSQADSFPSSSTESLRSKLCHENILLQSTNDLPNLSKFYPVPVSSMDRASTPSNTKESVLMWKNNSFQKGCNLQQQQFYGNEELCAFSPMSPCICFAVHQQEFNAECPNCHACMNCDTNCLKHMNCSKGDFQEINGYANWEDTISEKSDTSENKPGPVVSEYSIGKQGHIIQGNMNGDTHHGHFNTEHCDDEKGLFKENIDFNCLSLIQKPGTENANIAVESNDNAPSKLIAKKLESRKNIHPSSQSPYRFTKSSEGKPKRLVTSMSPLKAKGNSPLSHKSRKSHEMPLFSKADAFKKLVFPSISNLKPRTSREVLEILKDPSIQKKLERLPAMVKGYLTRRLFQTEKVQDLVKTLKDTVLIIGKLSEELTSKRNPVSEQDVDFHRQLIVQLMTTFRNVYDIFCTYTIKEQMKVISESRSIRLKKKSEENKANAVSPAISESSNSSLPSKNSKISAATVKSLERKRRSSIDNRTYTIEDFRGCRPRICSKARLTSPSRIYQSAMNLNLKSNAKSVKTQHWK